MVYVVIQIVKQVEIIITVLRNQQLIPIHQQAPYPSLLLQEQQQLNHIYNNILHVICEREQRS